MAPRNIGLQLVEVTVAELAQVSVAHQIQRPLIWAGMPRAAATMNPQPSGLRPNGGVQPAAAMTCAVRGARKPAANNSGPK